MGMMMSLKCLWVITGKVLSRPAAGYTGLEVRKVCGLWSSVSGQNSGSGRLSRDRV